MYLILLISGIAFIPQAHCLKCNEIRDYPTVAKTYECHPDSPRCGVLRILTVQPDGVVVDDSAMGKCMFADECDEASYNVGSRRIVFTGKCCDTDLCNTEQPPLPTITTKYNGKKCHLKHGSTDAKIANCTGDETYCFRKENDDTQGCATKNMCKYSFMVGSTCCEGDFCNVKQQTTAGPVTKKPSGGACNSTSTSFCLLLMATLISLFFFSH